MLICCSLAPSTVLAFGPEGHTLVGTIAERVLASKNPAAATKVKALLNSLPLGDAALIADDIKHWNGAPDPAKPWTMDTILRHDVWEFLQTNSNLPGSHGHSGVDHHSFHYTDVSVDGGLNYDTTVIGAGKTDVVKMISHCIGVIEGTTPTPDQYSINPRVAVIMLSHYLGDIHQPLHVGAVYFNAAGNRVDPDAVTGAAADHGGNDIRLHAAGVGSFALHSFWDGKAVDSAVRQYAGHAGPFTSAEIDARFVNLPAKKPNGTALDDGTIATSKLSVMWANEMLPIAKTAHDKLTFQTLPTPVHLGSYTFRWKADEVTAGTYLDYAGDVVDKSIHRAGWRLALLLERLAASL